MALIGNLVARLRADHTTWRRDLRSAQRPLAGLQRSVVQFGAAVGVAFSTRAIINFSRESVRAFARQEDAVQALRAALAVTGKEGAADLARLTTRAAQLQQVTTKGDEAIISATASLALLATQLDAAELARAQEALIGIADVFTRGDVEGAALLVGKTIGSTTNALTRFGIQVDTTASQSQKLAQIMAQSNKFFQVSEQRATTLAGRLQQAANAWGDLKEAVGGAVVEGTDFLAWIEELTPAITGLIPKIVNFGQTISDMTGTTDPEFRSLRREVVELGKDVEGLAKFTSEMARSMILLTAHGQENSRTFKAMAAAYEFAQQRLFALKETARAAAPALAAGGGGFEMPRPRLAQEGGLTPLGGLRAFQNLRGVTGPFPHVETVGPTLARAANQMNELASVTITGFGRMLQAASLGMDNMAVVVINSFNQIIQSLSRRGGPFGGFLGGLLGPIAGAAFGVIGALVSQRSQPQRVHVASFEEKAKRDMKDVNRVLVREILVFVRPGQSIAEAEAELARRRRRGVTPSRVG